MGFQLYGMVCTMIHINLDIDLFKHSTQPLYRPLGKITDNMQIDFDDYWPDKKRHFGLIVVILFPESPKHKTQCNR